MGEAGTAARDKVDVAGHVQLADFYFLHPAVFDFPLHAHAGDDGDAHAHLYEALDAFDGGHFDGHVELGAMAGEELDDAAAKGRFDAVGDEVFVAEVFDIDFALFGEDVFWGNDEGQFVFADFGGLELRLLRNVGDGADIEAVVEDFVGDVARKHAMDADENAGVELAERGEGGQQGVDGAFVDAEREFAARERFEFAKPFFYFVAEIDQALGVVHEEGAGVGEADGAGATDEERLAEAVLEFANGEADGRLRAVKAFGGAGEAAFLGDHQKYLEFSEIHGDSPSRSSISQDYQKQNKDKFDHEAVFCPTTTMGGPLPWTL